MLDCCEKIFLGEVEHGSNKVFEDLIAPSTGAYTIVIKAFGIERRLVIDFTENDPITIPSSVELNEDALYTMNVIDPDGEYMSIAYLMCFTFKTVIEFSNCNNCNDYIYGINYESSIDDDPMFDLGFFE